MTDCSANRRICPAGVDYVRLFLQETPRRIAVIACEGACVKGEVARVAANLVGYRLAREQTIRICLGDAITASSGFDQLVASAPRVIAIEGCGLCCGARLLQQRFPQIITETVIGTHHYVYDKSMFEIFDMLPEETLLHAYAVAAEAVKRIAGEINEPSSTPVCATACRPD